MTDIRVLGFRNIILKNSKNSGVKERLFVKYTNRVLKHIPTEFMKSI
jgi:hypothetical protein